MSKRDDESQAAWGQLVADVASSGPAFRAPRRSPFVPGILADMRRASMVALADRWSDEVSGLVLAGEHGRAQLLEIMALNLHAQIASGRVFI